MFRKKVASLFFLATLIILFFIGLTLWTFRGDIFNRALLLVPLFILLWINFKTNRYLSRTLNFKYSYLVPLIVLFSINVVVIVYDVALSYSNYHLKQKSYTDINSCSKVWSARGLALRDSQITPDDNQNSIESIQRAFSNGAVGAEVDVFYDAALDQYIVSHDRNPYHLKNAKLLTLNELFTATGKSGYFWLDFIKLRHLNSIQLKNAVARLDVISQRYNLSQRIFVEGAAPFNLKAFQKAGFKTIFDTHPTVDSNILTPFVANAYKMVYFFGDFSVISMNYSDEYSVPIYGQRMREILGNIPTFIYHLPPDKKLFKALSSIDEVQVLLPQDQSLNMFSITHCDE